MFMLSQVYSECEDAKSHLVKSQNLIAIGAILEYLKYKIFLKLLLCVRKQMAVGGQMLCGDSNCSSKFSVS